MVFNGRHSFVCFIHLLPCLMKKLRHRACNERSGWACPCQALGEVMSTNTQYIVQKLWNYCNILRDDGMSYGDYVEQLTYLLFLKMAHERTQPPYNQPSRIPREYDWDSLLRRDGDELETHYRHALEELGKHEGMLGIIFRKAQNKIQDPAKLRRLSVVSQLEATVEANLKRAGRLVPQDPDDEPASVLLGRIRADREKRKHGVLDKGREVICEIPRPKKIDVKRTKQVELWEGVER